MKEESYRSTPLTQKDLHEADSSEPMSPGEKTTQPPGIVVIGRNEGQRLADCLQSALAQSPWVIYVDSGSTDDSLAIAKDLGADIVVLDPMLPFTAARARNAGLERLLELHPVASTVQFVDGDCQLEKGWCDRAVALLEAQSDIAVVCGRRRERYPEASLYNRLCDLEWDTPIGEAQACGGDALMRIAALRQVNGYNPQLIAGEEPELCLRLRHKGWRIWRMDATMTWHDARMLHWTQWWRRAVRGGHAYAEVSWMHRQDPERFWMRESRRIWGWGLILPLVGLGGMLGTHGWSLCLGLAYPLLMVKIYRQTRDRFGHRSALYYGIFCTLGKWPELLGQLQFHRNRLLGRRSSLIEYKFSP